METLINRGGILSGDTLNVWSNGAVANSGKLHAQGTMHLASVSGAFTNTYGEIVTNTLLAIDSGLDFHNAGQIRSLGNLSIASSRGAFSNSGALLANGDIALSGKQSFANTGDIQGSGALTLVSGLGMTNSSTMKTGGTLALTTGNGLVNSGEIHSRSGMTVAALDGDLANTGTLLSGGDMSLDSSGGITNQKDTKGKGNISVAKTLTASAQRLVNSGEIIADANRLAVTGVFSNTGMVDGGDVVITAASLENVRTGIILGNHLSIGAGSILNGLPIGTTGIGTSGLLGARYRLDLGGHTITNREDGLIYSGGDIFIGGALDADNQATGRANLVRNSSAVFDAAGGITAVVDEFRVENPHFASELRLVSKEEYQGIRFPNDPPERIWVLGSVFSFFQFSPNGLS